MSVALSSVALSLLLLAADSGTGPSLLVADELVRDLVPVARPSYSGPDLDPLFTELRARSRSYCRMRYNRQPFNARAASQYIAPKNLPEYREGCFGCRWDIMAGCWNFYRLNDVAPQTDFELVSQLVPADGYDCYSVGLMQPYMMHNVLGCRSLTMIDFDWRIHDAHFQLLRQYQSGAIVPGELESALAPIELGWIARTAKGGRHELPAELLWLCKREQRRECAEHLLRFADTRASLERVVLNLASLHEVTLTDTEAPRVFYLSNALDPLYMSRSQIDELLDRIRDSLADRQRALLIYHAGGDAQFGIYELHRTPTGHTLTTACRDRYPLPGVHDSSEDPAEAYEGGENDEDDEDDETAGTYWTPLDRRSRTRGAPACLNLLAQNRDPKPRAPPATQTTLVAHWTFDDTGANAAGDEAAGTVRGARFVDGAIGRGLSFDGRDDAVAIATDDLFDGWEAVTITAWVRPERGSRGKWPTLIEKAGGRQQHVLWAGTKRGNGHWAIQVATNRGEARFRSFRTAVPYGKWSHVAVVVDLRSNVTRLFVNGELARERHLEARGTALHSVPRASCSVGQITRKKENVWKGGLDDVRIFRGALSISEIAALAARD